MAYPLIEGLYGSNVFVDGKVYPSDSEYVNKLKEPYEGTAFYETIRVMDGVALFIEEHFARLAKSIEAEGTENVDFKELAKECDEFLKKFGDRQDLNLRIVTAGSMRIVHFTDIVLPTEEDFKSGVRTAVLNWERQAPNVKAFRGDYKKAVACVFAKTNAFEVVLADREGKIYEGSKSNFFVLAGDTVYSAPDDKILIGITRKRVLAALESCGLCLATGTFTLPELEKMDCALFVSSTPFDILPIAEVDGVKFSSANNEKLLALMASYRAATQDYINAKK